MNKRERVAAALAFSEVDRPPISVWGHFPSDPHKAEDLVAETLGFQSEYDWDFVKLMPSGMYYPEALGCMLTPASGPGAVNGLSESTVKTHEDWGRIPVLDPASGWLAEHVKSVKMVRDALGSEIMIVQTLFSPLTVAHKMAIHVPFEEAVAAHRDQLEAGLRAITAGSIRFAVACLDAGADGFFFATQQANLDTMAEADFVALGKRYDLEVLEAIAGRSSFNLLHVCRTNILAEQVADYPVHAINWESSHPNPTLAEARQVWKQALMGGIDRGGAVVSGSPSDVEAEVRAAVDEAGRTGLIVGAGCALPVARKSDNLRAARRAVEAI